MESMHTQLNKLYGTHWPAGNRPSLCRDVGNVLHESWGRICWHRAVDYCYNRNLNGGNTHRTLEDYKGLPRKQPSTPTLDLEDSISATRRITLVPHSAGNLSNDSRRRGRDLIVDGRIFVNIPPWLC